MSEATRSAKASALAGGLALALLTGCGSPAVRRDSPTAFETHISAAADGASPEIAAFYRVRGFRPLWTAAGSVRPEADALLGMLAGAEADGLIPADYGIANLSAERERARNGDPTTLACLELLLSEAFVNYARDLHQPGAGSTMLYIDQALAPVSPTPARMLMAAAAAPSLTAHLAEVRRVNPVFDALRDAGAASRQRGKLTSAEERIIRANLDRARALPADPGARFVLVDAAGATLSLYENGRVQDTMRVIVGKPGMETPMLAGLIRFAMLNPYWNIPPDLVRDTIAPRVLREGVGVIARDRLELLSGWSADAQPLDPEMIDWMAVASGAQPLRVRQLPGPDNMMGRVKFMLPNRLGIYLHDTPGKAAFRRSDRRLSSGCVRVEDAARLYRWLFGGASMRDADGFPEQRIDLPTPVPVYITYFTAVPDAFGGIRFQPDRYGRDRVAAAGTAA